MPENNENTFLVEKGSFLVQKKITFSYEFSNKGHSVKASKHLDFKRKLFFCKKKIKEL